MNDLLLAGFVADLSGSEDFLVSAEPVVAKPDGHFAIAHGNSWSIEELRPVKQRELRFATLLDEENRVEIRPNEVVWLAGRNFVTDVRSHNSLADFWREIGSAKWKLLATRGYKWRLGTVQELDDMRVQMSNRLEAQLHRQLFDQMEKTYGGAESTFRLYQALDTVDTDRRAINVAVYHFETRDEYAYELTRHRAIVAGLFKDESEFDSSVERSREHLAAVRLSDAVEERLRQPADNRSRANAAFDLHKLKIIMQRSAEFDWVNEPLSGEKKLRALLPDSDNAR